MPTLLEVLRQMEGGQPNTDSVASRPDDDLLEIARRGRQRLAEEPPPGTEGSTLGNIGRGLAAGGMDLAQALGNLPNLASLGAIPKAVDLDDEIAAMRAGYTPGVQEQQRNIQEAEGFFGTLGAALENPAGSAQYLIESAPSFIPGAAGGKAGAVIGAAIKSARAAGRGLAGVAARQAAQQGAMRGAVAGLIGTNAALSAGFSGEEARQTILGTPEETLRLLPEYQRLAEEGVPPEQIREELSLLAGQGALPLGAVLGAATGMIGAPIEARLLSGVPATAGGALSRLAATGGSQFAEEAAQEGSEQFSTNVGVRRVDPNQPLMEGVPEAAAIGGLLGAGSGVTLGAVGELARSRPPAIQQKTEDLLDAAGVGRETSLAGALSQERVARATQQAAESRQAGQASVEAQSGQAAAQASDALAGAARQATPQPLPDQVDQAVAETLSPAQPATGPRPEAERTRDRESDTPLRQTAVATPDQGIPDTTTPSQPPAAEVAPSIPPQQEPEVIEGELLRPERLARRRQPGEGRAAPERTGEIIEGRYDKPTEQLLKQLEVQNNRASKRDLTPAERESQQAVFDVLTTRQPEMSEDETQRFQILSEQAGLQLRGEQAAPAEGQRQPGLLTDQTVPLVEPVGEPERPVRAERPAGVAPEPLALPSPAGAVEPQTAGDEVGDSEVPLSIRQQPDQPIYRGIRRGKGGESAKIVSAAFPKGLKEGEEFWTVDRNLAAGYSGDAEQGADGDILEGRLSPEAKVLTLIGPDGSVDPEGMRFYNDAAGTNWATEEAFFDHVMEHGFGDISDSVRSQGFDAVESMGIDGPELLVLNPAKVIRAQPTPTEVTPSAEPDTPSPIAQRLRQGWNVQGETDADAVSGELERIRAYSADRQAAKTQERPASFGGFWKPDAKGEPTKSALTRAKKIANEQGAAVVLQVVENPKTGKKDRSVLIKVPVEATADQQALRDLGIEGQVILPKGAKPPKVRKVTPGRPTARQETLPGVEPRPRARRATARPLNPDEDTLVEAIAKLGGLNRAEASRAQIEDAVMKDRRINNRVFGYPVFPREGGRSFDDIAGALMESGYLTQEEMQSPNPGDVVREKLRQEIDEGKPVRTVRGYELAAEREAAQEAAEAEAERMPLFDPVDELDESDYAEIAGNTVDENRAAELELKLRAKLNDEDAADELIEGLARQYESDEDYLAALDAELNRQEESVPAGEASVPDRAPAPQRAAGEARDRGPEGAEPKGAERGFRTRDEAVSYGRGYYGRGASYQVEQGDDGQYHAVPARPEPQDDTRYSRAEPARNTDTAAFRNWFGDSVVTVDGKPGGEPRVMYHGTWDTFTVFDPDANERGAIFVTPSKALAQDYGMDGQAMALYVKAEKVFDPKKKAHLNALWEKVKGADWVKNVGEDSAREGLASGAWEYIESPDIFAALKEMGYDGVYVRESGKRNLAVFSPEQVKSATSNIGTFDPNNPDIRYSQGSGPRNTAAAVRAELNLTPRAERALLDSGLVTIVQSASEIPGSHPADVAGAYHQGKIYLVADNIPAGRAEGLILHEIGVHHGLKGMVGDAQYAQIVQTLKRQVKVGSRANAPRAAREAFKAHLRAAADTTIAGNEDALWEETIAYLAESGSNAPVIRRLLAAVRAFMRRLGLVRQFTAADMAHLARGSVQRVVEGMSTDGQPATMYHRVFHGTPHLWQPEPGFPHGRPRLDKIGTGEGAQVYGHGIYLAELEDVADSYREQLTHFRGAVLLDGKNIGEWQAKLRHGTVAKAYDTIKDKLPPDTPQWVAKAALMRIIKTRLDGDPVVVSDVLQHVVPTSASDADKSRVSKIISSIENSLGEIKEGRAGQLYHLDIPNDVVPKLLDWNKKLSEQPQAVQDAILKEDDFGNNLLGQWLVDEREDGKFVVLHGEFGKPPKKTGGTHATEDAAIEAMDAEQRDALRFLTGEQLYKDMVQAAMEQNPRLSGPEAARQVSEQLREAGIPGNRYLDAGSRDGRGNPTHNIVLWDQDVLDRVALLKRNEEALQAIQDAQDDARYSFAGQRAATADKWGLGMARMRLEAGADPEAVRQETGWFKGVDGKWRFEIDDADAGWKIPWDEIEEGKLFGEGRPLAEVLDHPKLFAAYPDLRDVTFHKKRIPFDFFGSVQGWFNSDSNTLVVTPNVKDADAALSTALHEMQHWVQSREGFASGGNDDSVRLNNQSALNKLEREVRRALEGMPSDDEIKAIKKRNFNEGFDLEWAKKQQTGVLEKVAAVKERKPVLDELYKQRDQFIQDVKDLEKRIEETKRRIEDENKRALDDWSRKIEEAIKQEDERRDASRKAMKPYSYESPYNKVGPRPKQIYANSVVRPMRDELSKVKDKVSETNRSISAQSDDTVGYHLYRLIAGEMEARDVQGRKGMTAAERRATKPYSTEGIPDENLIVVDEQPAAQYSRAPALRKGMRVLVSDSAAQGMGKIAGKEGKVTGKWQGSDYRVNVDGMGEFVVSANDLVPLETARFKQITPAENKRRVKAYLAANPDVDHTAVKPGETFLRVVWEPVADGTLETNPADLVGLPKGQAQGLHVTTEPESWAEVLQEDYDRGGRWRVVEIEAMPGDVLVDDPQQAMPTERFGRMLDSSILITGREVLKRRQSDKVYYSRAPADLTPRATLGVSLLARNQGDVNAAKREARALYPGMAEDIGDWIEQNKDRWQEAAEGQADTLYSRTDSPSAARTVLQEVDEAYGSRPTLKERVGNIGTWFKSLSRSNRRLWLNLLTRQQIVDVGKDVQPLAGEFEQAARQMDADANQLITEHAKLIEKWTGKVGYFKSQEANDQAALLARTMHEATIAGFDPSVDKPENTEQELVAKMWNALDKDSQQLFKDVRDAYTARRDELEMALVMRLASIDPRKAPKTKDALYRHAIDKLMDQEAAGESPTRRQSLTALRMQMENNRVKGPYFPLSRFGDYYVIATKDGEEKQVMRFETGTEWRRVQEELKADGWTVEAGKDVEKMIADLGPSANFMQDIFGVLESSDANLDEATMLALKDDMWQLFLMTLPDQSIRKHFIHRQNRRGFSQDALRAFSHYIHHSGRQIARLRYSGVMSDLLHEMEGNIKGNDDPEKASDILGGLRSSFQWMMNPNTATWAQRATSIGFGWYLGVSPAAAVMNMTQVPIVAYPVLGAQFGPIKAARELTKAMAEYTNASVRKKSWEKMLATSGLGEMLDEMERSGAVDRTLAASILGLDEQNVDIRMAEQWAMQKIGALFHKAERWNREVTAIAAYRLEMARSNNQQKAVQAAYNAVFESQFDYSGGNRAAFMRSNTARVLLLFRQYSQNMTYLLWRNFQQSLKGADKETRRIARNKLMGVLGMTGAFAGVMGLPLMSLTLWVTQMAHDLLDDDEDEWDAELALRQQMREWLGPVSDYAARGVFGAGIGTRTSLDQLWIRSPYENLEGRDLAMHYLEQAAGPVVGIGTGLFRGAELMARGNIAQGFETMVPKAVKDFSRAMRYNEEGVQSLRGDQVVARDELDAFDLFMQASGMSPHIVVERYDQNRNLQALQDRILRRRRALINRYYMAWRDKDRETMREIVKDMQTFSRANPRAAISGETIRNSIRGRAQTTQRRTLNGSVFEQNLLPYLREQQYLQ